MTDALMNLYNRAPIALGHAHPALVAALTEQASKLWHVSNIFRIPGQEALANWTEVLAGFGITAMPTETGCFGMAGLFGHEAQNQALSRDIVALRWADATQDDAMLATGFSCRCQTQRLTGSRPLHPVELIDRILSG